MAEYEVSSHTLCIMMLWTLRVMFDTTIACLGFYVGSMSFGSTQMC